jgi:hypothetical protein
MIIAVPAFMPPRKQELRGNVLQGAPACSAQADKAHKATQAFMRQYDVAERASTLSRPHMPASVIVRGAQPRKWAQCATCIWPLMKWQRKRGCISCIGQEFCSEKHAGLASGAQATAIKSSQGGPKQGGECNRIVQSIRIIP